MPFVELNGERVRICSVCKRHDVEFYARASASDGKRSTCKDCNHKASMDWAKANPDKVSKSRKKFRENNPEKCRKWEMDAAKANPEVRKKARAKWADANKELDRDTRKKASEKWKRLNKGKVLASNANRRSAKINATAPWSDEAKIKEIYEKCVALNKRSVEKYHVDHIVPLIGYCWDKSSLFYGMQVVSGLHVENNLQIVPAKHNLKKGSSWNPLEEQI